MNEISIAFILLSSNLHLINGHCTKKWYATKHTYVKLSELMLVNYVILMYVCTYTVCTLNWTGFVWSKMFEIVLCSLWAHVMEIKTFSFKSIPFYASVQNTL